MGWAGEFGHMQVVPDGRPVRVRRAGLLGAVLLPGVLLPALRPRRVPPSRVRSSPPAQAGDPVAMAAYAEVGRWLGVGAANVVAGLDPALVVVGGGVSAAGDLLLDPARTAMAESLVGAGHRLLPDLIGAELGPLAGVVGVADLARPQS